MENYLTVLTNETGLPLMTRYFAKLENGSLYLYNFYNPTNPISMLSLEEVLELRITDREFNDLPYSFELVLKHTVRDYYQYEDSTASYQSEFRFGVPTNAVLWEACPDSLQKGNIIYNRPMLRPITDRKIKLQQAPQQMAFVVIADNNELRQEWWEKLSRHLTIKRILSK
eukprot:NODE_354_length_10253_cov_0.271519.p5 type:complete len:170 gc:universal NODE_354_length_10253_cov_0.271519:9514-10023(+)